MQGRGPAALSFIIFTVNPSLQTRQLSEFGDRAKLLSLNLKQDVEVGRKLGVIFVRFEIMGICTNGKYVSPPALTGRYIMTRTNFGSSRFPMTRTEMVLKTLAYSPFSHLTGLPAREYFIENGSLHFVIT